MAGPADKPRDMKTDAPTQDNGKLLADYLGTQLKQDVMRAPDPQLELIAAAARSIFDQDLMRQTCGPRAGAHGHQEIFFRGKDWIFTGENRQGKHWLEKSTDNQLVCNKDGAMVSTKGEEIILACTRFGDWVPIFSGDPHWDPDKRDIFISERDGQRAYLTWEKHIRMSGSQGDFEFSVTADNGWKTTYSKPRLIDQNILKRDSELAVYAGKKVVEYTEWNGGERRLDLEDGSGFRINAKGNVLQHW